MPCLSRNDIEQIAACVIDQYKRACLPVKRLCYAVDPLELAHMLGLKVVFRHLSDDGTVLGMTSPDEVCVTIFDNNMEEMIFFLDGKTILGYDVHRLVDGRDLIIGGVNIPYEKGLLGHSDADVLAHAIMDSILGALALGDIGKLFPDSDPEYKDSDSLVLMKNLVLLIESAGMKISNIDSTVIAEAPKLSPHIEKMRENIALALNIPVSSLSVKATRFPFENFHSI